ncbi:RDD family protein [Flavobacterium orientale]|uniref:RDD domain-containing protein n=1 Tax=Flavobacterium orientale TaxID=1756020 RepID=A0A917DFN3_9FLAO|nr:RDD family protein [Flavobacterium orientale]GGD33769.1 hypothetical protein GCM10011343_24690 [Flavobacterium orientale]
MNDKLKYLIKRVLSAFFDLVVFAIVCEPFGFIWNNGEGETNLPTYIFFALYYFVICTQEFFFNKTIGKFLFGLKLEYENNIDIYGVQKFFKLFIRRAFDFIELICPFSYFIFIIVNKENKKLGDYLTGITIKIPKN